MKKADIKIGEEYAFGLGSYDEQRPKRVRVLEFDVARTVHEPGRGVWTHKKRDGIRVEVLDPKTGESADVNQYLPYGHGIAISRAIMMPWSEWVPIAEKRRQREAEKREAQADRQARFEAIQEVMPTVIAADPTVFGRNDYRDVVVSLETMEKLLGLGDGVEEDMEDR